MGNGPSFNIPPTETRNIGPSYSQYIGLSFSRVLKSHHLPGEEQYGTAHVVVEISYSKSLIGANYSPLNIEINKIFSSSGGNSYI